MLIAAKSHMHVKWEACERSSLLKSKGCSTLAVSRCAFGRSSAHNGQRFSVSLSQYSGKVS